MIAKAARADYAAVAFFDDTDEDSGVVVAEQAPVDYYHAIAIAHCRHRHSPPSVSILLLRNPQLTRAA
jgi:hypothetical protein